MLNFFILCLCDYYANYQTLDELIAFPASFPTPFYLQNERLLSKKRKKRKGKKTNFC